MAWDKRGRGRALAIAAAVAASAVAVPAAPAAPDDPPPAVRFTQAVSAWVPPETFTTVTPVDAVDVNDDGELDLVGLRGINDVRPRVLVLPGDGTGRLGAPLLDEPLPIGEEGIGVSTQGYRGGVVAADLDGDDDVDVAAGTAAEKAVRIFHGDGEGGFAPSFAVPVADRVGNVRVADLDGDDDVDIVASHTDRPFDGAFALSVLWNEGDSYREEIVTIGDNAVADFGIADMDVAAGNGPDIVVIGGGAAAIPGIYVVRNTGASAFGAPQRTATGYSHFGGDLGDVDNDGDVDVVARGTGLKVLRNDGTGVLTLDAAEPVIFEGGGGMPSPHGPMRDLDGDGNVDSYTLDGGETLAVLLGRGDGTFEERRWATGTSAANPPLARDGSGVILADIDGEGTLDGWAGSDWPNREAEAAFLPGDPSIPFGFRLPQLFLGHITHQTDGLAVTDWNGDDHLDVLGVSSPGPSLFYWPGNGDGTLGPRTVAGVIHRCQGILAAADLDRDGNADIVCTGGQTAVFFGDGAGGIAASAPITNFVTDLGADGAGRSIAITDFNGDTFPDVAIYATNGCCAFGEPWIAGISVSLYNPDIPRTFVLAEDSPPVGQVNFPEAFAAGDFDGDGKPDLVTHSDRQRNGSAGERFMFLAGAGDGTFAPAVVSTPGIAPIRDLEAADLDGDGDLDLAGAGDGGRVVLLGGGDGTFDYQEGSGGLRGPVEILDVNGDARPDFVQAAIDNGGINVGVGGGDGTFSGFRHWHPGRHSPVDVAVGDLDEDGLPELVVLNFFSRRPLSVIRNEGLLPPPPTAANLRVVSVEAPEDAEAGQPASVTYRVANVGDALPPTEAWIDRVYLSGDPVWDPKDVVVASVSRTGGLAAAGEYEITVDDPLLPPRPGTFHVIVKTDVGEDVTEPDEADNVEVVVPPLDVDVPLLLPGDNETVEVADDELVIRRVPGTEDVRLLAEMATGSEADVAVARDRIPTPTDADLRPAPGGTAAQTLSLAADGLGGSGDWFVLVRGRDAADAGAPVQLEAETLGFSVLSTTPTRGSNAGTTTIEVDGGGFQPGIRARLENGPEGHSIGAAMVERPDRTSLGAAFALTGAPVGTYDLTLVNPDGETITVFDGFEVEATPPGELEILVEAPERMRVTQHGTVTITLRNVGGTDVLVPELLVTPHGLAVELPDSPAPTSEPASFLPTDPGGPLATPPQGRIPPGEERAMVLKVIATAPGRGTIDVEVLSQAVEGEALDVVPVAVAGPAAVAPGDTVGVDVRLRNTGEGPRTGPFVVWVGLTEADEDRPAFLTAGSVEVAPDATLLPGQELSVQAQVVVPAAIAAEHRWVASATEVRDAHQVDEAAAVPADGADPPDGDPLLVMDDEPVQVGVGVVGPGASASGELDEHGFAVFELDRDTPVADVALTRPGDTGGLLRVGDGYAPTAARRTTEVGVDEVLRVGPAVSDLGRFLTIDAAGEAGAFELTVTPVAAGIDGATPSSAGNAGNATLRISGAGLAQVETFRLDGPAGASRDALTSLVESDVLANATFDLTGLASGSYSITALRDGDVVATAPALLDVVGGGAPVVDVSIEVPSAMRLGQPASLVIVYRNSGDVDAPLPLVRVEAGDGGELRYLPGGDSPGATMTLVPPAVVPGVAALPPGSVGRMTIEYTPTEEVDSYSFTVEHGRFDDPGLRDAPLDWDGLAAERPPDMGAEEWAEILAEDRDRYGETYGDLYEFLTEQVAAQGDAGIRRAAFVDGRWLWPSESIPTAPMQIRTAPGAPSLHVPAALRPYTAAIRQIRQAAPPAPPGGRKGKVWVLVIQGNEESDLPGAKKDADEFLALMRDTYNLPAAQLSTLRTEGTTRETFDPVTPAEYTQAIRDFMSNPAIGPDDTLIIFSNSHGVTSRFDAGGELSLSGGKLPMSDIADALKANTTNPVLYVNDSCYSGMNNSFIDQANVATLASAASTAAFDDPSYSHALLDEWRKTPNDDIFAIAQRASDAQRPYLKRFSSECKAYIARAPVANPYDIRSFAKDGKPEFGSNLRTKKEEGKFTNDELFADKFPVLDAESIGSMRITRPENKAWFTDNAPTGSSTGASSARSVATRGEPAPPPACPTARSQTRTVEIEIVSSLDPNEIRGPAGVGGPGWVARESTLGYTISFENIGPGSDGPVGQPVATAPALQVAISHPLDSDIDLDSLSLDDVSYGAVVVDVPESRQSFTTVMGDDPGEPRALGGDWVQVVAVLDRDARELRWTLTTIDSATGLPADGAADGFLPPEDGTGAGRGAVGYRAAVGPATSAGSAVEAQASIVFDQNPAIETNRWSNLVDAAPPDSSATAGGPLVGTGIPIVWSASDDGAGAQRFDVFVSRDGAPFTPWLAGTTGGGATFAGLPGHSYGFAAAAVDGVGHVEPRPTVAQVTVAVPGSGGGGAPVPAVPPPGPVPCPADALAPFGDVDPSSPHAPGIGCMAARRVILGFADGLFRPQRAVTREQVASLVDRLATSIGRPFPEGSPVFRDMVGSVHESAVNRLAAAGIVRGTAPGVYSPTRPATRAEVATILARALDRLAPGALPPAAPDAFADDDGLVHERSIDRLAAVGIVAGRADGRFDPGAWVTRAEMASFLARSLVTLSA